MKEALLNRPWILIIAGYVLAISGLIFMVVIAVKHPQPTVPLVDTAHK